MNRRTPQLALFLIAVVLPAVALSFLTFRYLHQDAEMARRLEPGQRREAVEQVQRELAANLDAIRLQEINRRSQPPKSGPAAGHQHPAIVFALPLQTARIVFPWENIRLPGFPTARFVSSKGEGEFREFQTKDLSGAASSYRSALAASQDPAQMCESRLALGRVLVKSGKHSDALEAFREILRTCKSTMDDLGMPYSLYAAERLITLKLDIPLAEEYLVHQLEEAELREIPQGVPLIDGMVRTLLQSLGTLSAKQVLERDEKHQTNLAQALAVQSDLARLQPLAEKDWVAFGEEPWLLKLSPNGSGPPLLFAVSSRKIAPPGATLLAKKTSASYTLDRGFSGLEMELDPDRSFAGERAPAAMIAAALGLILVLTVLSGYLFIHGVNRDLQTAELRSHFVASVSHELKTPLTAIRMFAETLSLGRTNDDKTRDEYLETIVNESERLARLVDNVLDFSKIEQGKKIYRMRPTFLPDVIQSAARAMRYPLSQQGFSLNVSVNEDLPKLSGDADALEQAILNLLSNAMKYSGEGRQIDLSCDRRNGNAVIAVTDHGIGISEEHQARVFEKFYRVRESSTNLIAGTGLGLTLVKHIAQAHGGSVQIESAPGRGSTFSIHIPVEVHQQNEASS